MSFRQCLGPLRRPIQAKRSTDRLNGDSMVAVVRLVLVVLVLVSTRRLWRGVADPVGLLSSGCTGLFGVRLFDLRLVGLRGQVRCSSSGARWPVARSTEAREHPPWTPLWVLQRFQGALRWVKGRKTKSSDGSEAASFD